MSISLDHACVPMFKQMLDALSANLAKAEAYATEKNIEPDALLHARLFPDMLSLTRQVQIACDFARGAPARLSGTDLLKVADDATSFADLQQLIATTLAFISGIDSSKIRGQEEREIVLRPGTPKEKKLSGETYLLHYALPQFFFHVTTAYAILRHNGAPLGKVDFMGKY
jgi:hypothetical protein